MPQLKSLALPGANGAAGTTFVPRDITNNVATLASSSDVPLAKKDLSLSVRRTPNNRYKAIVKGRYPVVQENVVDGVADHKVVRAANFTLEFSFDANSTKAEREAVCVDINSLFWGGLTDNIVYDAITNLEGIY